MAGVGRGFSRGLAQALAGAAFLILVVGVTYFAILVIAVRYGEEARRAAAFHELGQFLTGGLAWYQDARIYGASSLVLALVSILFGVAPLARITLLVSGSIYVTFLLFGEQITEALRLWAAGA
ncbi:MAG: hypothetical protein ACT4PV_15870 [Planctomycetaceae bacterium]